MDIKPSDANAITSFSENYRFLSNFYQVDVEYEGVIYPSSEHAYVAAKTLDQLKRLEISKIETPGKVKRFGRNLELRSDWEEVKLEVMRTILLDKFKPDCQLFQWLQETAPHELTEGNSWGDTFWGQCPIGNGKNHLGKLLMSIRDDITTKFME